MSRTLKVGIIGANAHNGWARESHVPAVQKLQGLTLLAVATNSKETADASAEAFGVKGYSSGMELVNDPEIDIVTVATRVPDHRDLVLAAINAGKHVLSEWPLGRGVKETEELDRAARSKGVKTAIGLQLRGSPVVRKACHLIETGAIGRLLTMNIFSATAGFGADVPDQYFYLEDPSNFANLVTIQGAHTLDLAFILAGEFAGFNSLASRQYPSIRVGREGSVVSRQTYDHLLVQGVTSGGAVVSIEVAGGRPAETPFRLELVGEKARINLQGGSPRGFQSGGLELRLDDKPVHVDYGELALLPEAASNVGGIYATFRDDILNSTSKVAGFGYAVRFTKVIDAILNASGRKLTGLSRAGE